MALRVLLRNSLEARVGNGDAVGCGALVDGQEGSGGVFLRFEEWEAKAAAAVVGAGDDVFVGDGCGASVGFGFEAKSVDGAAEVDLF